MTLKEELELIRGEPVHVFAGDPMDIPCIETSDADALCRHPVVSVHMLAYNHEPYIRQAIEGVMMQKTDFEYELVIGEDCSADKTRDICFEYQKRHPDRIRVLWSHENSYLHMHPAGGNAQRTMARCRGEFVAFCEGDDYWTDPLKLQKQVDVMRRHGNVAICFSRATQLCQRTGKAKAFHADNDPVGLMSGEDVNRALVLDFQDRRRLIRRYCIWTAGVLIRRRAYDEGKLDSVEKWCLSFDDVFNFERCLSYGDAFFMAEEMAVYRRHGGGVTSSAWSMYGIIGDEIMARCHLAQVRFGMSRPDVLRLFGDRIACVICKKLFHDSGGYVRFLRSYFKCHLLRDVLSTQPRKGPKVLLPLLFALHGVPFVSYHLLGIFRRLSRPWIAPAEAMEIFRRYGFPVSAHSVLRNPGDSWGEDER